jgi:hypothetical protein
MAYSILKRTHPKMPKGKTWIDGVQQDPVKTGTTQHWGLNMPTQETFSYRTGRLAEDEVDVDEEALFHATTYGETFSLLKEESRRAPQSDMDTGHEFWSLNRETITPKQIDKTVYLAGHPVRYSGPLMCDLTSVPADPYVSVSPVNTGFYGPAAVRATIPTHPLVNLSVGLAELQREGFPRAGASLAGLLRDVHTSRYIRIPGVYPGKVKYSSKREWSLPAIKNTGGKAARVAAEEQLAIEFGAKPLIRDLTGLALAIATAKTRIAQAERDSGKLLHRKFSFPAESSTSEEPTVTGTVSMCMYPSGYENYFFDGSRSGVQTSWLTTTRKTWFSGAYTYYFESAKGTLASLRRMEQELNLLLGSRLTAETLWNLAPWSWLADWNANLGTNISNATYLSDDGLVMKYGYLMSTITVDRTVQITGPALKGQPSEPFVTIFRSQRKERVKASPFGFSSVPGSYSARQWAILGALGYTHAPGVL